MLNMMKLDWLSMKSSRNKLLITYAFAGVVITIVSPNFALVMLPYLAQEIASHLFVTEEEGKVNRLYINLPINRKTIVRSRFWFVLVGCAIGVITAIILTLAIYALPVTVLPLIASDQDLSIIVLASGILLCALMNIASIPVYFKVGYGRGKIVATVAFITIPALALLPVFLSQQFDIIGEFFVPIWEWIVVNIVWTSVVLMCVSALIFAASYVLSQRIFAAREF